MASHFDPCHISEGIVPGWGDCLVRTGAQMVLTRRGDYQQQGIMAITETRWLLLLRADEKSIGQNRQGLRASSLITMDEMK